MGISPRSQKDTRSSPGEAAEGLYPCPAVYEDTLRFDSPRVCACIYMCDAVCSGLCLVHSSCRGRQSSATERVCTCLCCPAALPTGIRNGWMRQLVAAWPIPTPAARLLSQKGTLDLTNRGRGEESTRVLTDRTIRNPASQVSGTPGTSQESTVSVQCQIKAEPCP